MDNEHRRGKWQEYANVIVPFLGPVLFEIANSVTGEWITAENKLSLSTGKVITIIIGIVYIGVMIYLIWIDKLNRKTVDEIENALEDMKKRETMYKKSMNTVGDLLAYSGEKLKNQIEYLKEHDRIDVRDLNINAASTNIANIIYQSIMEWRGEDTKITVNIYSRETRGETEYSTMIAHVGAISQPDALGEKRLLSSEKSNLRYCEKTLLSNRPDYKILLNKQKVARAFGQSQSKCKYNQYLGIPVRQMGGQNIALIEIVAHDTEVLWNTEEEATMFAARYCEVLKEYILLIDRMYEQGVAVANKLQGGV